MNDIISQFSICSRCGDRSFDSLQSYGYRAGCNHFIDYDPYVPPIPEWAYEALKKDFSKPTKEEKKETENECQSA